MTAAAPQTGVRPAITTKSKSPRTRSKKADLFPKNLKVVVTDERVPDQVRQNPGLYQKIGEDHHDEPEITRSMMHWNRTVISKLRLKEDRTKPPAELFPRVQSVTGVSPQLGFNRGGGVTCQDRAEAPRARWWAQEQRSR